MSKLSDYIRAGVAYFSPHLVRASTHNASDELTCIITNKIAEATRLPVLLGDICVHVPSEMTHEPALPVFDLQGLCEAGRLHFGAVTRQGNRVFRDLLESGKLTSFLKGCLLPEKLTLDEPKLTTSQSRRLEVIKERLARRKAEYGSWFGSHECTPEEVLDLDWLLSTFAIGESTLLPTESREQTKDQT